MTANPPPRPPRRIVLPSLLLALTALPATAADWPQWGGPGRNFEVAAPALAASWPEGGPKVLWQRKVEDGYSAAAVADGRLYTMTRSGGQEKVLALDAASGETRWEHAYAAPTAGQNLEYGPGPHATPLVAGERVFTAGALGELRALERATGKLLWRHDLWGELGGTRQDRGYSSSPLAYGDMVIVQVGGKGNAVVAFRQADGAVAWKQGSFDNSPSSPLLIDLDGRPQLVVFLADQLVGLDPASGAQLWTHPHSTNWGLNISLPLWGPDRVLFFTSAYNGGSGALRLHPENGKVRVEPLWKTNQMRVHFTSALRRGDHIYGSSGDFGPIPMSALELASGKIAWRDRTFSRANLLQAGERTLLLDEDGTLAMVSLSPTGMKVLAQAQVLDGRCWTAPSLVGNRLYVRSRTELKALELPLAD